MSNTLLRLIGSKAVILHDDPTAYDRLRWIYPYLSKGNKKILDAGCGCGGFSLVAAKQGNTVIGVSFDKTANTKAQENAKILKLTNIDFLALDLRELEKHNLDKFDQIMCFETFAEKLRESRSFARENSGRRLCDGHRVIFLKQSDNDFPISEPC